MRIKLGLNFLQVVCLCAPLYARTQPMAISDDAAIDGMNEQPAFVSLRCGDVKPSGWVRSQMEADLHGFVGNLDKLVPTLINDPIYGEARLHSKSKLVDLGNKKEGDAEGDEQYKWWNSETQSNWWDGYVRNALLLDSPADTKRVKAYVDRILSTQDEDGYLGIYTPELRYKFKSENGELWAKATLYRSLLGYYEATGDERVWDAVVRAVGNVMENYPIHASEPFDAGKGYNGGVGHGLSFTDVLDRMFELTGDRKYLEYAEFLYQNYSKHFAWEQDAQLRNALDKDYKLKCHAVHTYEHVRSILVAATVSPDAQVKAALKQYLDKIAGVVTPTGGAIGDEWIAERQADATHTGYEYCSLHELMDSYVAIYQKTGQAGYAEMAENIFYNAAQGARHPRHTAIAYLKTDNSYNMTGGRNYDEEADRVQTRYKYSPVHQDVAVCCVPNAGRITPYFLQKAWFKAGDDTLIANFLAPNVVETEIAGQHVSIENVTEYPAANKFSFKLSMQQPVKMVLKIRKPSWVTSVACSEDYKIEGDYIVIDRKFKAEDSFSLEFGAEVRTVEAPGNKTYFAYGARFFALPIEAKEIKGREYAPGFSDYLYEAQSKARYEMTDNHNATFRDGKMSVNLKNSETGLVENVTLLPMRDTILRQMTF